MKNLQAVVIGGELTKLIYMKFQCVTFPAYENTSVQARSKQVEQIKARKLEEKRNNLLKRVGAIKNVKAIKNNESTRN